jgi:hypothetical protein
MMDIMKQTNVLLGQLIAEQQKQTAIFESKAIGQAEQEAAQTEEPPAPSEEQEAQASSEETDQKDNDADDEEFTPDEEEVKFFADNINHKYPIDQIETSLKDFITHHKIYTKESSRRVILNRLYREAISKGIDVSLELPELLTGLLKDEHVKAIQKNIDDNDNNKEQARLDIQRKRLENLTIRLRNLESY